MHLSDFRIPELYLPENAKEIKVKTITSDSRNSSEDCMFIAIKGNNQDGHNFISQAQNSGACAIICESLPEILNDEITYIKVLDSSKSLGIIASNFFDILLSNASGPNTSALRFSFLARYFDADDKLRPASINK